LSHLFCRFAYICLVIATISTRVCASDDRAIVIESGDRKASLIELFTSQGCSSCPPAEKWLNKFSSRRELWIDYVPVAFHVDYWNGLGWKDPFSSKENSARQRRHQEENHLSRAYTPCFLVDGREWKGWFSLNRKLPRVQGPGHPLSAKILDTQVDAWSSGATTEPLVLHIALLGFDIESQIKAGENVNRTLHHNFTALAWDSHISTNGRWSAALPVPKGPRVARYGVALWINRPEDLSPLQAIGGWLPGYNPK